MSTIEPGEDGDNLGSQRWEVEQQQIDTLAEQDRLAHEAERLHAYEAAEEGEPVPVKRPWWKFWGAR